MITENRLTHILAVARKSYKIAKDFGYDETFAREMFALGFNHDIGYEFNPIIHEQVGAEIFKDWKYAEYIGSHGIPTDNITIEWVILNLADMTTSPMGKEVSMDDRLLEIEQRYGKDHIWYKQSEEVCNLLKEYLTNNEGNTYDNI